jgi:glutathione S-transferase
VFNDFKDYPRLKTWFERCMARNASKKCLVVCPELA